MIIFKHFLTLFLLPRMWYPLSEITDLNVNQINKCKIFNKDYIVYKREGEDATWVCHTSICPHQGADLGYGYLNKNKDIVCPYHGFVFDNEGIFQGIQNQPKSSTGKRKCIEIMKTIEHDNMLFISKCSVKNHDAVYSPIETYDASFRYIHGSRLIQSNYLTVIENLLDNLHISFVHSFGSRMSLPTKIQFSKIDTHHGKTTFEYQPNDNSISHLFTKSSSSSSSSENRSTKVIVENEYILPTSTITRVFFGRHNIKTVFTRCCPISENESRLHWRLYRNYWIGNDLVDNVGDTVMKILMEQTLDEDVCILKHVNDDNRVGSLTTKYDRTILEFRKSLLLHKDDDTNADNES